MRNKT